MVLLNLLNCTPKLNKSEPVYRIHSTFPTSSEGVRPEKSITEPQRIEPPITGTFSARNSLLRVLRRHIITVSLEVTNRYGTQSAELHLHHAAVARLQ